jgi:hypothetical protein
MENEAEIEDELSALKKSMKPKKDKTSNGGDNN